MPYARTNYTLKDIQIGFRSVDTNKTKGAIGGIAGQQPSPHAEIHGASAELFSHPLFAKGRTTAGDGPATHSVMNATQMQAALITVFNSAPMQAFLAQVDAGNDANVNVNLNASPGAADVYNTNKKTGVHTANMGAAVVAFFVKVRPNPGNKDVPIIQTCVPMTTPYTAGQLVNKKKVVTGITV